MMTRGPYPENSKPLPVLSNAPVQIASSGQTRPHRRAEPGIPLWSISLLLDGAVPHHSFAQALLFANFHPDNPEAFLTNRTAAVFGSLVVNLLAA